MLHTAPSRWSWALNFHSGPSSPLVRFPSSPSQLLLVWRQVCPCASASVCVRSGINQPILLLPGIGRITKMLFLSTTFTCAALKEPPLLISLCSLTLCLCPDVRVPCPMLYSASSQEPDTLPRERWLGGRLWVNSHLVSYSYGLGRAMVSCNIIGSFDRWAR